jgi:hypothetical protein
MAGIVESILEFLDGRGEHRYEVPFTPIGDASKGATTEMAFRAFRGSATPFAEGRPVSTGDTTVIPFPFVGPVTHFVDPESETIVNITKPGHPLHPGVVFLGVEQRGDQIGISGKGFGRGAGPNINKNLAELGWPIFLGALSPMREKIAGQLNPPPSTMHGFDMGGLSDAAQVGGRFPGFSPLRMLLESSRRPR